MENIRFTFLFRRPDTCWFTRVLLPIVLLCVFFAAARAQQTGSTTVSGKVSGTKEGEVLVGVNVVEKGTTNGTVTDSKGEYSLSVGKGAILTFSFIGYNSIEIPVNNRSSLDVTLEESSQRLEQVVVIGYGAQKSSQISSSIAKINASALDLRPNSQIDKAMVGKLSGVQVQEVSGRPGRPLAVKIRGTGSISGSSNPLYVVDGYPISSGLDNINPNDIESIEVLKDAASAAIYGSRASNGVVLVTTKSGKSGKPVFSVDVQYGVQKRFSKVDVLNRDEYIDFAIEERNNTWVLQGGSAGDPNEMRANSAFWIDPLWLTDPKSFPDHDWQDLVSRSAPVQNYQLSASGGTDNLKYYISGGYFSQDGIILGSDYKRLSFRANVEAEATKFVTVGLNVAANSIASNDSDGDGTGGPVIQSIRVAPIVGLEQQTQAGGYYPYHAAFMLNPVAMATDITNRNDNRNIVANLYSILHLAKDLNFRTSFGTEYYNGINQYFLPDNINRGGGHMGRFSAGFRENLLNENTLTYDLHLNKLETNFLAGFTVQKDRTVNAELRKTGFPDDEITTLNLGTTLTSGTSTASEWGLLSYLARVNTSWNEKYLLSASIRRDGSSRFGADRRWGWFPAISVGWRIAEEDFMQSIPQLNELKIRVSYGVAGNNDIGDYASIGTLASSNYVLGQAQAVASGFSPGSFSNRVLSWERKYTLDLGLDVAFFQNRISAALDFYSADSRDLLLNVQVPAISGFSNALQNIGAVRNYGAELEVSTKNTVGRFKWTTTANLTHNRNKVIEMDRSGAPIYGAAAGFNVTKTEVGSPIGSYYLFVQDGIFKNQEELDRYPHYKIQNVGDIRYKDVNGDGVINDDDKMMVGSNNPKVFWGMMNTFSYGSLTLNISMDGQHGNKLLNIGVKEDGQSRGNVKGLWRDRWRSPEDPGNGWVPRAAVTDNLTTPSTFWLRDASFWRIRTISLGYNLPAPMVSKLNRITGLYLYASADNVFMRDHYNRNPQTAAYSNSSLVPGIEYEATYPLATTYTLGLNLKF